MRPIEINITDGKGGKPVRRRKKSMLLPVLLCLAGVAVLFYPVALDWYASYQATQVISEMVDAYDPLDDPALVATRTNAEAYNTRLATGMASSEVQIKPYEEQMLFRNMTQMAWIDIPKIEVALPIYHGTSDDVLAAGVGHLEDTSLPVGGESSHCVLTGHSGMQGERMFDEIRRLEVGDTFIVHSLGLPYAYRVYDIEVVWPSERQSLRIQQGRDLCTLVTCTPYGVNDHRLLVHAERCEYLPEMEPHLPPRISYWNTRSLIFFGGCAVVVLFLIALIIRNLVNRSYEDQRRREDAHDVMLEDEIRRRRRRNRMKKPGTLIIPGMFVFCLVTIMACAVAFDWLDTTYARNQIAQLSEKLEAASVEEKVHLLDQALIYNEVLAGDTSRYARSAEGMLPYDKQLALDDTTMMACWVDIPKLNTKMVVYHGEEEDNLLIGAGHIQQTSLPVAGESSHTVVSAHAGMALTRAFDELHRLQEGDVFILWTLGEPYAYEVTGVEVVLPDEANSLKIDRHKDQATLVTCTPYGINDHRLLVHGKRCDYSAEMSTEGVDAYVNYRTIPFLGGIALGIPLLILITISYRRRKKAILAVF